MVGPTTVLLRPAAQRNIMESVKALLKLGADALPSQTVKLPPNAGADPVARDGNGGTPLNGSRTSGLENRRAVGTTGSGQLMHSGATPVTKFRKQGLPLRFLNESKIVEVPDQGCFSDKHTFGCPTYILNVSNSPVINERLNQQPPWHQYPSGKCICPLLHGWACPRTADVSKPVRPALIVQDMAKFVRDGKSLALCVLVVGAAFVHDYDGFQFDTGECHTPN